MRVGVLAGVRVEVLAGVREGVLAGVRVEVLAGLGIRSFQKNGTIFALFSILYKRMERSLRSFPFFIKERNHLCVLFCSL